MIQIRDARKSDALCLGALSRASFGEEFDETKVYRAIQDFAEETETEDHSVFSRYRVAEIDEQIVGMCGVYRLRWVGTQVRYLGWFFVDPLRQRQGIGGALLEDSISISKAANARWLMVETDGHAIDAQRLYGSHGFKHLTKVPDFWPDGDSLVLMGLRVSD